jgi:hypothetical protein
MMTFIERGRFHNKKKNLQFMNNSLHFDRHGFVISIIKPDLSHDKRKNFTVTKIIQSILLKLYRDATFWDESSTITAGISSFTTIKWSIWMKWKVDVT